MPSVRGWPKLSSVGTSKTLSLPLRLVFPVYFFSIVPFIFFTNEKVRVKAVDYCGLFWILSTPDIRNDRYVSHAIKEFDDLRLPNTT